MFKLKSRMSSQIVVWNIASDYTLEYDHGCFLLIAGVSLCW